MIMFNYFTDALPWMEKLNIFITNSELVGFYSIYVSNI